MKQAALVLFSLISLVVTSSAVAQTESTETSLTKPAGKEVSKVEESAAKEKSKLRILFVGRDPDLKVNVPSYISGPGAKRLPELKKERMAAFKAFLEPKFETIKFLNSEDYKVPVSNDYDVTIFDTLPPPIEVVDMGNWKKKLRMPLDFDRPALLIGEVAPVMLGRLGVGLRMDHL